MYNYENLVSFEVKATLAEHYACAENIHKEDAEGEHYQGGEGALSQVIDLYPAPAQAFHCSGMTSGAGQWVVSFAIKARGCQ